MLIYTKITETEIDEFYMYVMNHTITIDNVPQIYETIMYPNSGIKISVVKEDYLMSQYFLLSSSFDNNILLFNQTFNVTNEDD